jgi:hypothetical protein
MSSLAAPLPAVAAVYDRRLFILKPAAPFLRQCRRRAALQRVTPRSEVGAVPRPVPGTSRGGPEPPWALRSDRSAPTARRIDLSSSLTARPEKTRASLFCYSVWKNGASSALGTKREACRRIARQDPVSSSPCLGMVSVSLSPPGPMRRSLTWLPRCEMTSKPNLRKMATTSWPESRLSRGRVRLQLEGDEDAGRGRQPQFRQVFSLQV